jgi:hypothetical protein
MTFANPDGFIEIEYCSTEDQLADVFIKPVQDDIVRRVLDVK